MRKAEVSSMKGLAVVIWIPNDRKGLTVNQRKYDKDSLASSPSPKETELKLIQRKVGNRHRFWNLGSPQIHSSKTGEDIPGRNARKIERYIPKVNCAKVIKERQEAIHRLFIVRAYILSMYVMSSPRETNAKPRRTSM